jgi:hypothetical protein
MKKIILFFSAVVVLSLFTFSCSNDSKTDPALETTVSPSLRIALTRIINNASPVARPIAARDGEDDTTSGLCFDFVYPITLSYNTGTSVVVNSLDEIITLLQTESSTAYLNGIAFPFQIQPSNGDPVITIANEAGFETLNLNCGDDYYFDDDIVETECYEFQFPFSVINNINQVFEVVNLASFYNLLENPTSGNIVDFVYPINLTLDGQTVVINNQYDFTQVLFMCYGNDGEDPSEGGGDSDDNCNCTTDYNPVCVMDDGVVVTFSNACVAICEGYNESEFINCQ